MIGRIGIIVHDRWYHRSWTVRRILTLAFPKPVSDLMHKSQFVHQIENGGNLRLSLMQKSDAQIVPIIVGEATVGQTNLAALPQWLRCAVGFPVLPVLQTDTAAQPWKADGRIEHETGRVQAAQHDGGS